MDSSCSSIKADRDRPRDRPHPAPASAAPSSRHDLLKRPSRDRDADRTSDRPAGFSDAGRDFRRKSHAPDRDDLDESSERGERSSRSFPRKTVSAFERSDRHFSGKPFTAERDRSDRTDGGRRKFLDGDRDGVDKFESTRSFGRRSYGGNGRQETPEGSLNSPSWEERDHGGTSASRAARKGSGFDREWRDGADSLIRKGSSGSEHCAADDADFCRSPSGKDFGASREGPIPSKFSPSRSHTLDRREPLSPRTLSKLSPRDNRVDNLRQKLSPKIASETTRDHQRGEESQRPPLKLKSHFKREDEPTSSIQRKDEGASSDEADTWIWRRNSSSKGHGFSHELVEESSSEARSSHDEGWRERRTDTPITYFHIAKKVRSDRRREERGNKGTHQVGAEDSGTRNLSLEKLRPDVAEEEATVAHAVQKADAGEGASKSTGNPDLAVAQGDEKPLQKTEELHANGLSSNREDESEMEEGELPDEDLKDGKPEKALINLNEEHRPVDSTVIAEEKKTDATSSVVVAKEEKVCEYLPEETPKVEIQPDDNIPGSSEVLQDINSKHECGGMKMEEEDVELGPKPRVVEQCTGYAVSISMEIGESSKEGTVLKLLDEKSPAKAIQAKDWNAEVRDGPSKELTLSLFTQSFGEQRDAQLEGNKTSSQREPIREESRVRITQARSNEQGLGCSLEGKGEHSDYGHKQKKMKLESLGLSLALPGTSMSQPGGNPPAMPGPVEPERSFQSLTHTQTHTQNMSMSQTRTNSDGFTTSLSLSQSQSFIHNPSCSLNCTSMENQELSCGGSRQFSQGNDQMSHRSWQTLSGNEQMSHGARAVSFSQDRSKHKRGIPLCQRVLQNQQGFPSATASNRSSGSNHFAHRNHHQMGHRVDINPKILDSSSQGMEGSEKQGSSRRDFPDRLRQQEAWLASKGSRETRSEPHGQRERERLGEPLASTINRFNSVRGDDFEGGSMQPNDKLGLQEIASEPVATMAQKLQELPDSFLDGLKGLAKEVLASFERREEFMSLQNKIGRRTDLTVETLLLAHRTQLEILVALKTGMQAFLQEGIKPLTNTALMEIFLQTKCRNIACQRPLPVYGCGCRICSQKKGFCLDCMCVVCFKFDSDNNTCRWVGCDVCSHWCHTDCGLRMSFIAPAPGVQSVKGTTEMQYRCAACDHHSELFGFVKEVFHKCAEGWGAEALAKELDCVRRIFHGSEDMRGKQLCWKAEQMLTKLESKVPAAEVCRSMLRYFNDGNAELDGACAAPGVNKQPPPLKQKEASDSILNATREVMLKTPSAANKNVDLEKAHNALKSYDKDLAEKRTEAAELQYDRTRKRAEIEDIESVVRMKQAESKMFQVRADEAREAAGGLQRIISVKREKIEEDYACKYAKLRLGEAEERRAKRAEELKALERAQHDYQKMKIRMEAEIKDLLVKMETTKRQFT